MREPIVYQFSDMEAMFFSKAFHRKNGLAVRGPTTIAIARRFEQAGLVTLREFVPSGKPNCITTAKGDRTPDGLVMLLTSSGREAWKNAGLIAAGRKPECSETLRDAA